MCPPFDDVALVVGLGVDAAAGAEDRRDYEQAPATWAEAWDGELSHLLAVLLLDERPVAEEAGVRRDQDEVVLGVASVREAGEHDLEHMVEVGRRHVDGRAGCCVFEDGREVQLREVLRVLEQDREESEVDIDLEISICILGPCWAGEVVEGG